MKLKKIFITCLLLVIGVLLTSCNLPIELPGFPFGTTSEDTKHQITFVNYDDSILLELELNEGEMPEYTLADPTRENTAQFSYTFVGWDKIIGPATEDLTYKAMYTETINKYLVTFADEDGTVLESKEMEYGQMPSYSKENPTKDATLENTYTFAGWDKELTTVTEDVTYTATYVDVKNAYEIKFIDLEGNLLYSAMFNYGETPVYGGETPILEGNDQY